MKKVLKMGDLLAPDTLPGKIASLVDWKNLTVHNGYGADKLTVDDMLSWVKTYGDVLKDFVCDTTLYLAKAVKDDKRVMFEAQLGALRDIDYGIFPYTSSSSTIASYAPIGAGIPFAKLDNVIGITKAFSSCVGEGPFVCELFGEKGNELREAGQEYGAATGRPRRVGGFDVVASKYGCMVQGATELVLTKLDILSYLEKNPGCVAYEIDGEITTDFVTGDKLSRAKPVYEYFEGFKTDISNCRTKEELPKEALDYIKFVEDAMGIPIKYVSVGASRDAYIVM